MDDRRALAGVTIAFVSLAAVAPVAVVAFVLWSLLFPPPLDELPDPRPPGGSQLSTVQDVNGREIAVFREFDQRLPLRREDIPVVLKQAVVAVEDKTFYTNNGLDVSGTLRALIANVQGQEIVQGGSTITQQYVKNELVGPDRSVRRKLREATLAYQLERRYTKDRILELYLNAIYFGNGAYGVQAASRRYFGVEVDRLTLGQSALLAGFIQAPARTDPYQRPEAALARRRVVLAKMARLGTVHPEEAVAAEAEPLALQAAPVEERSTAPYFVERVKQTILDDERFGPTAQARRDLLLGGGLRITTTLDRHKQALAEAAVAKVLSQPDRDPTAAVVSLEPRTGYVRALVGGRDYYGGSPEAKFDLATQADARPGRRSSPSSWPPPSSAASRWSGPTPPRHACGCR